MAAGFACREIDPLVDLLVEQADDGVAHADGVRYPVIARQGGVNLPAEAALAVARRPVDEQAASGGNGQAGQLGGFRIQDQAREGR